ncbi:putative methyltransferase PMT17 [Platanthera guangdongensis]|uniref:Methyltransferase n=1 Tax=Platanthera guangdongensis TaxID=2320717 RepID=A0ABR2LV91_9ASPA
MRGGHVHIRVFFLASIFYTVLNGHSISAESVGNIPSVTLVGYRDFPPQTPPKATPTTAFQPLCVVLLSPLRTPPSSRRILPRLPPARNVVHDVGVTHWYNPTPNLLLLPQISSTGMTLLHSASHVQCLTAIASTASIAGRNSPWSPPRPPARGRPRHAGGLRPGRPLGGGPGPAGLSDNSIRPGRPPGVVSVLSRASTTSCFTQRGGRKISSADRQVVMLHGLYLLEVDRVVRPGGYWILSGPPINWKVYYRGWERTAEDLKHEQDTIEDLAKRLCWKKVIEKGDLAGNTSKDGGKQAAGMQPFTPFCGNQRLCSGYKLG